MRCGRAPGGSLGHRAWDQVGTRSYPKQAPRDQIVAILDEDVESRHEMERDQGRARILEPNESAIGILKRDWRNVSEIIGARPPKVVSRMGRKRRTPA